MVLSGLCVWKQKNTSQSWQVGSAAGWWVWPNLWFQGLPAVDSLLGRSGALLLRLAALSLPARPLLAASQNRKWQHEKRKTLLCPLALLWYQHNQFSCAVTQRLVKQGCIKTFQQLKRWQLTAAASVTSAWCWNHRRWESAVAGIEF